MKKQKTTKRALLMSALSLLLCLSMLVGTTFAWFTDSVTSGNNTIQSGNLDIELEYWNGNAWVDVAGKSDILTNTLWEPGVTEVAYLRIANAGSLALKYQLGINIVSETAGVNQAGKKFKLSDYIQFGVIENVNGETGAYANREAAVAAVTGAKKISAGYTKAASMTANQELYLALVVWMPTTVGNEANYKTSDEAANPDKYRPSIDLGINIVATQYTYESDSYGPDYDDGAYIPVAPETIPGEPADLVLKGSAESNVTVEVPKNVVNNLPNTVTSLSVNASAPVVDTNSKTVSFSTVELVDQNGKEVDIAETGAKVTVILPVGGAFANGERVEVYHDGSFVTYATVEEGKISYEVSHFCEVEVKSAEEVVLDNTIDSVKEFIAFAAAVNAGNSYAGQTVVLGADLDLAGVTWTPIGTSSAPFKGTFDGNGKVIKNLSVLMAGKSNVGLFGFTTDGEIKNVTVENAKISGRTNVGVVAGTPYTSKYTNIIVKGHVEVDGMAYVGAVGGKNAYADWNNITVEVDAKSYVNAYSVENGTAYRTYVGGVVGFNGEGGHSFTNITSNINVIGSTIDVGGAFGIAHYGNKFENITVTGNVTITNAAEAADAEEMGGIAGVWHNENGTSVTFNNCTFNGKLSANYTEGVDLTNNTITGKAYSANGTGLLFIDGKDADGNWVINDADALKNALANVKDGDVIKFVSNITFNKDNGYNNGGSWFDGLGYAGDKSFTLDLNGKTLTNDSTINDYLVWLKNTGTKENTITIKNGTLDATSSAYCALCTASSHDNKLTVNLENVKLYNNNSNGSTVKIRANSVLNVKDDTVITGKNSYLGIENWNATVNIYDGAEIYMNGTSSYNGCLVGVGGNGTINIYGGYGKGVSGGIIAMTSGGTINVSGGEWIANTDGAYANDNKSVLIAQSDKQYNAGAGNAVVNVTGGTFKGGYNCYGNAVGDAQINISGGTFNNDPARYVIEGYKTNHVNGVYVITDKNTTMVSTADELVAALEAKQDVIFANDITMKAATTNGYGVTGIVVDGQTINGNGYTFKVTGAGTTWDSTIYIKGGKIENLKITGAMRGVFMGTANADVYLENVSFGTIYTFNSDGGNTNYGVYISNSTMNGWTSHSNVHKEVVYTNCTFTEGSGYKYCRPYGPTKFVNCTFTAGFTVDESQTSAITFENCTFAE